MIKTDWHIYTCWDMNMYQRHVCHRHRIQVRKEKKRFGAFVVSGVPVRMLADEQMNIGSSSVHAQWFSHSRSEQMIMTS